MRNNEHRPSAAEVFEGVLRTAWSTPQFRSVRDGFAKEGRCRKWFTKRSSAQINQSESFEVLPG